jgi:hypothetical protein
MNKRLGSEKLAFPTYNLSSDEGEAGKDATLVIFVPSRSLRESYRRVSHDQDDTV